MSEKTQNVKSVKNKGWGQLNCKGVKLKLKHRSSTYVTQRFYSHSTAETARLRAAAVGLGLLGNDERLFTGVGVQSMNRVMRVVGQGAAVPHRGLSYIQDLITHCLLVVVVVGEVVTERQTAAPPRVPEEAEVKFRGR